MRPAQSLRPWTTKTSSAKSCTASGSVKPSPRTCSPTTRSSSCRRRDRGLPHLPAPACRRGQRATPRRCGQDRRLLERPGKRSSAEHLLRGRPGTDAARGRLRGHDQGLQAHRVPLRRDGEAGMPRRTTSTTPTATRSCPARSSTSTAPSTHSSATPASTGCAPTSPTAYAASSPTPAASRPRVWTSPPSTRSCSSRRASRLSTSSVGRPRHAQGARQTVRLHHPAGRHPRRDDSRAGVEGQQAVCRGVGSPAGLRAHDERFNAMVNRIELVKRRDDKINVIGVPGPDGRGDNGGDSTGTQGAPR